MKSRCGITFCLLTFAVVTVFLGIMNLSNAEAQEIPVIFAYIPFAFAAIAILAALCIITGIWTPSSKGRYTHIGYR